MTDPRVDPETGSLGTELSRLAIVARVVMVLALLVACLAVADAVVECIETEAILDLRGRVDRLERLHLIEQKREKLAQKYRRRLEQGGAPEPEVPL